MEKKRNEYIDILRGIGIISVVLGHVLNEKYGNIETEIVRKYIYIYHLPLFFFISGYFIKKQNVIYFLKNKIKSLYFPCVGISLFSLLLVPLWVMNGALKKPTIHIILVKIFRILCFKADGYYIDACWFFSFFFISVVLFELSLQITDKLGIVFLISSIEGILGILLTNKAKLLFMNFNIVLTMQPVIFWGYFIKRKKIKYQILKYSQLLAVISGLIILLSNSITGYEVELSKGKIYGNGILFFPIMMIGILFSCSCAKCLYELKKYRVIAYIGKYSNIIMMLHFIAFKVIDILFVGVFEGEIEGTIFAFPQIRVIYLMAGILLPLAVNEIINVVKKSIKNMKRKVSVPRDTV